MARCGAVALGTLAMPAIAGAHGADEVLAWNRWSGWAREPALAAGLVFGAALYASGLHWLRRATASPSKLRVEAVCFFAGWTALVVALVSPLHAWGQRLFSLHMVQHEVLMVIAAPLLVLGRPLRVCLWAFPRSAVRRVSETLHRVRLGTVSLLWEQPFVATLAHALALWLWHVPAWFVAAESDSVIHALQHASFFGTGLAFWNALFFGHRRRAAYGLGLLYLFLTAGQSGALGALITLASHVWYPAAAGAGGEGLSPLEDQQLGGLIMWVPGGLIYVGAALAMFVLWLRESDRRTISARPTLSLSSSTPCAPSV